MEIFYPKNKVTDPQGTMFSFFLFFYLEILIFPPKVTFHGVMYVRERIKTFSCLQFKKFASLFRSFQRFLLPKGYYISTFQMRTLEFGGMGSGREKWKGRKKGKFIHFK